MPRAGHLEMPARLPSEPSGLFPAPLWERAAPRFGRLRRPSSHERRRRFGTPACRSGHFPIDSGHCPPMSGIARSRKAYGRAPPKGRADERRFAGIPRLSGPGPLRRAGGGLAPGEGIGNGARRWRDRRCCAGGTGVFASAKMAKDRLVPAGPVRAGCPRRRGAAATRRTRAGRPCPRRARRCRRTAPPHGAPGRPRPGRPAGCSARCGVCSPCPT